MRERDEEMSGEEADVIISVFLPDTIDRLLRPSPVWMNSGPPHLATRGQIMIWRREEKKKKNPLTQPVAPAGISPLGRVQSLTAFIALSITITRQ